ncbi:hypothetical protein MRX96_018274 [Rhipicephalus microplus]
MRSEDDAGYDCIALIERHSKTNVVASLRGSEDPELRGPSVAHGRHRSHADAVSVNAPPLALPTVAEEEEESSVRLGKRWLKTEHTVAHNERNWRAELFPFPEAAETSPPCGQLFPYSPKD